MGKSKSFSHIEAQDALEQLNESVSTGEELLYSLLRIFCNYGDGQIRRIREGIGNRARDGRTILVPKVIAFRPKDSLDFHEEIKQMQAEPNIVKHAPRLYVVSDGQTIVAVDPIEQDIYENEVALMWKDFEFFYPLAGIEKFRNMEEAEADVKSAELMAKIYDEIRRHNDIKDKTEMHNLNVFMSRLLFCFFAEDTNLFSESNLFTSSIRKYTADDGHDLAEFIERAFLAMSIEDRKSLEIPNIYSVFPYVNGGLFKQHVPIPTLSRRARILMLKCGDYDWKEINPDIFGSMIQVVVTPEMRAGLGMHYTSVPNIMKLIQPLFLDELHEEYRKAVEARSVKKLQELLSRMSKIKFFDPACGSGNFLIISYKRVRELEILIWQAIDEISGQRILPFTQISLTQFYGIEIDEYACDTAKLSLWLAEHQMNNKFHETFNTRPQTLPLRASGNIVCGNACRIDWNCVCPHTADEEVYIMGNPPYLGSSLQSEEQKGDMRCAIGDICKGYKKLDYISPWFLKGSKYILNSNSRFAFVTTNSITQGEQVSILWPNILTETEIYFAYRPFMWRNNAKHNAMVAVTILGLKNKYQKLEKKFFDSTSSKIMKNINPYLIEMDDIFIYPTLKPISPRREMIKGSSPVDNNNFIFTTEEVQSFLKIYPSVKPLIHKYIGAEEFVKGYERFCIYVETPEEIEIAKANPILQKRFEAVCDFRMKSTKVSTRKFASVPYRFIEQKYQRKKSIVVPQTGSETRKYIPMGIADETCVLSNAVRLIYCESSYDLVLLGILSSYMHMVWVRAVAGRMKMDMQYGNTTCYNTFPFPKMREAQKAELEKLAQDILDKRDENYDLTLGKMYNPESMPDDLREAHHRLDLAVERCYRPEPFTSDEERLEYLFKMYVKMTK